MRVVAASVRVLPFALLPVVAGLLVAHDATWSVWTGLAVGALGLLVALAVPGGGVSGTWLALVGAGLIALGTAAATSGLWMTAFGRTGVATVTEVHLEPASRGGVSHDVAAVRLVDGGEVAGELRELRPGLLHTGERVSVRYDPTGVIRLPQFADSPKNTRDAFGGPVALVVGFAVLVALRLRRGAAGADPPAEATGEFGGGKLSVADLRHRLDEERGR